MTSNKKYDSYIKKILKKDKKSEEEFYAILYDDARKFIKKQKFSKISYEDVVSESVIKVLNKLEKYQIGTNFKAWFGRIILNSLKDEYRKIKRHNEISIYAKDEDRMSFLDLKISENPKNLESLTLSDKTKTTLDKLGNNFKTALILAYIYNMQYEEIAKITDIPIGTVRSRLSRGKELFKKNLNYKKKIPAISKKNFKEEPKII